MPESGRRVAAGGGRRRGGRRQHARPRLDCLHRERGEDAANLPVRFELYGEVRDDEGELDNHGDGGARVGREGETGTGGGGQESDWEQVASRASWARP